jgi:chemotaxis response regulator CheB
LPIEGVSHLLAAHGIEVAGIARDSLEAVAMALQLSPNLILMDVYMPRYDGLSAPRQIKALLLNTRIVMLTACTCMSRSQVLAK